MVGLARGFCVRSGWAFLFLALLPGCSLEPGPPTERARSSVIQSRQEDNLVRIALAVAPRVRGRQLDLGAEVAAMNLLDRPGAEDVRAKVPPYGYRDRIPNVTPLLDAAWVFRQRWNLNVRDITFGSGEQLLQMRAESYASGREHEVVYASDAFWVWDKVLTIPVGGSQEISLSNGVASLQAEILNRGAQGVFARVNDGPLDFIQPNGANLTHFSLSILLPMDAGPFRHAQGEALEDLLGTWTVDAVPPVSGPEDFPQIPDTPFQFDIRGLVLKNLAVEYDETNPGATVRGEVHLVPEQTGLYDGWTVHSFNLFLGLDVLDISGRTLKKLEFQLGPAASGSTPFAVAWDGTADGGEDLLPGRYPIRVYAQAGSLGAGEPLTAANGFPGLMKTETIGENPVKILSLSMDPLPFDPTDLDGDGVPDYHSPDGLPQDVDGDGLYDLATARVVADLSGPLSRSGEAVFNFKAADGRILATRTTVTSHGLVEIEFEGTRDDTPVPFLVDEPVAEVELVYMVCFSNLAPEAQLVVQSRGGTVAREGEICLEDRMSTADQPAREVKVRAVRFGGDPELAAGTKGPFPVYDYVGQTLRGTGAPAAEPHWELEATSATKSVFPVVFTDDADIYLSADFEVAELAEYRVSVAGEMNGVPIVFSQTAPVAHILLGPANEIGQVVFSGTLGGGPGIGRHVLELDWALEKVQPDGSYGAPQRVSTRHRLYTLTKPPHEQPGHGQPWFHNESFDSEDPEQFLRAQRSPLDMATHWARGLSGTHEILTTLTDRFYDESGYYYSNTTRGTQFGTLIQEQVFDFSLSRIIESNLAQCNDCAHFVTFLSNILGETPTLLYLGVPLGEKPLFSKYLQPIGYEPSRQLDPSKIVPSTVFVPETLSLRNRLEFVGYDLIDNPEYDPNSTESVPPHLGSHFHQYLQMPWGYHQLVESSGLVYDPSTRHELGQTDLVNQIGMVNENCVKSDTLARRVIQDFRDLTKLTMSPLFPPDYTPAGPFMSQAGVELDDYLRSLIYLASDPARRSSEGFAVGGPSDLPDQFRSQSMNVR